MTSAARIEANRSNARKSTGPRTPEGKQRSSRNNTRHGLASKGGVVLSHAERALLSRRRKAWRASLAPVGARETALVEEMVFASVVLDRLQKIEGQALSHAYETAIERFDQQERHELDEACAQLAEKPALAVLRLKASAPGCTWLRDRLSDLRAVLARDGALSAEFVGLLLRLLGHSPGALDPDALTIGLLGMLPETAGIATPEEEAGWARVLRLLDEQIEHLQARHAALFPNFQRERATAPDRAWLPAEVATLVIRHGGAWEGRFHRALRTLRRLQKARRRLAALEKRAFEPNAAPAQILAGPQPLTEQPPITAHAADPVPVAAQASAGHSSPAALQADPASGPGGLPPSARAGVEAPPRRRNRRVRTQRSQGAKQCWVRTYDRTTLERRARGPGAGERGRGVPRCRARPRGRGHGAHPTTGKQGRPSRAGFEVRPGALRIFYNGGQGWPRRGPFPWSEGPLSAAG